MSVPHFFVIFLEAYPIDLSSLDLSSANAFKFDKSQISLFGTEFRNVGDQNLYSPRSLKNILCLFLQIL